VIAVREWTIALHRARVWGATSKHLCAEAKFVLVVRKWLIENDALVTFTLCVCSYPPTKAIERTTMKICLSIFTFALLTTIAEARNQTTMFFYLCALQWSSLRCSLSLSPRERKSMTLVNR
jgi:hypothetical protein